MCVCVCVHACNASMYINSNSIVAKQTDVYVFSVFSKTVSVIDLNGISCINMFWSCSPVILCS